MTTTIAADARTVLDEADASGAWTGSATVSAANVPTAVELTNQLGMGVSNTTEDAFVSITIDDWSGGGTLFVWIQANGTMDTVVNGGIMIQVGDGTNRIGYHVGGSDQSAFRHDSGPVKWECYVLDLANKPINFTAFAGDEPSLNEAAITQVGVGFVTLSKALGGGDNCFWDIIRFADNGVPVTFVGGATSGASGNGEEAAILDRSTATLQAKGVIRELATGVYGIQGNLIIGDSTSSTDQFWTEANVTYAWEERLLSTLNFYRFLLIGSSTATNCEVSFTASTFTVPPILSASFDGNGADLTVCNMFGCTFIGFGVGIETSDDTGDSWTNCVYVGNGTVVANGCDLSGSSLSEYTGAANTSVLEYNLNVDPNTKLNGLTISKTAATAHHAIEFGTAIADAATFTLTDCAFGTDFSATADGAVGDETFHFLATTGSITLNLVGVTGNTGYRTEGVAVTIAQAVPIEVNGVTEGARVVIETDAGVELLNVLAFEDDGQGSFKGSSSVDFVGDTPVRVSASSSGKPVSAASDNNNVFADETVEANSANNVAPGGPMTLLPTSPVATEDGYVFGHTEQFGQMDLVIDTGGTGGFTITWEYWVSGAWAALSGVSDGTSSFSSTGTGRVSWTIPGDWDSRTISSQPGSTVLFYIRASYSAGSVTVLPVGRQVTMDVTKFLRWEDSNTVTASGLAVKATWIIDTIASF